MNEIEGNVVNSEPARLRKELSLRDLYFTALTAVIGTGWIFASYYTAEYVGPAAILSWIIGGIFMLIIAIPYAELGSSVPVSGGVARYPGYTHGPLAMAFSGWSSMIPLLVTPAGEAVGVLSVIQTVSVYYKVPINFVVNGEPTFSGAMLALVIVAIIFWINYTGIKKVKYTNASISYLKLVIIPLAFISIIVVGLQVGLGSNFATPSFAPFGYGVIFTALPATGIVYAYQGFRQPIDMAADAKNPGKDIWRAILLEVVTSIVFYTLLQVGFIYGLKWNNSVVGTTGLSPGSWNSLTPSLFTSTFPLFYVSLGLGLFFIAVLLIIGGIIGPIAETNQSTAAGSRIMYGLANERILPKPFTSVHGRYKIPTLGVLIMFIVTIFFMIMGVIGYLVSNVGAAWTALVSIISSTTVFAYMTGPISAVIIHKSYPELDRPFKVRGLSLFAILATVISGLIVYWGIGSFYTPKTPYDPYILIASMIIVSFLLWLGHESHEQVKNPWRDLKGASWMIIFLIAIGFFVKFGEFGTNWSSHICKYCGTTYN